MWQCVLSQKFSFVTGFFRYTAVSPSILSCADGWNIPPDWWWCKKTFCQCKILLECACVLPLHTHHDTCSPVWVTEFIFSSFSRCVCDSLIFGLFCGIAITVRNVIKVVRPKCMTVQSLKLIAVIKLFENV